MIDASAPSPPAWRLAWDATHDGRTVLRGSFNQYLDADVARPRRPHPGQPGLAALPLERADARATTATASTRADSPAPPWACPAGPTGHRRHRAALPAEAAHPQDLGVHRRRRARGGPGPRAGPGLHLPPLHQPVRAARDQPDLEPRRAASSSALGGYRNGRPQTVERPRHPRRRPAPLPGRDRLGRPGARAASSCAAPTPGAASTAPCSRASTTASATSPRATSSSTARWPTTTATRSS